MKSEVAEGNLTSKRSQQLLPYLNIRQNLEMIDEGFRKPDGDRPGRALQIGEENLFCF